MKFRTFFGELFDAQMLNSPLLNFEKYSCMSINPKTILLTILFSYSLIQTSHSQTNPIDSLTSIITSTSDHKKKIDALNELSYNYHTRDIQEMNKYALEALELAQKFQYRFGIGMAFYNLGIVADYNGEIKKAIKFDEKCLEIGHEINSTKLKAKATNDLGIIYGRLGDSAKAIHYHNASLQHAKEINDHEAICYSYLNLGSMNQSSVDSLRATEYYLKALDHAKITKSFPLLGRINAILGEHYMYQNDLKKSKKYIDRAQKIALQLKDNDLLGEVYFVLSNIYLESEKKELAVNFAQLALEEAKKVGNHDNILYKTENMIYIYGELKEFDKAISIGNEALDFAIKNQNPSSSLYLFQILSKYYSANNDYQSAYNYAQKYITLRDSSFNEDKSMRAVELEEQYRSARKEAENKNLKEKELVSASIIAQQKQTNYALITIALLLLLLGGNLYYFYIINKKRSAFLEEKVEERTQEFMTSNQKLIESNKELQNFAYIASHDLKEPIVTITAFSTILQKEVSQLGNPKLIEVTDFINSNSNRLLNLVQDLLEFSSLGNGSQKANSIDLNNTINTIQNIIESNMKSAFKIICNQTLPCVKSYDSKLFTLFLNLIANGLKYNQSQVPKVVINYHIDDSKCTFSIADNGIGINPEHFDKIFIMFKRLNNRSKYEGSGLGLASCKKIIESMDGKIWVESDNKTGSTFYFNFPVDMIEKIPNTDAKDTIKQLA